MSAVEYKNIGKSYGKTKIMEDVNFSIDEGDFVVLLGPSGCGKTTLLRMTAGLEKVTKGDVLFSGSRVNDVHPRDRSIAMVFQSYALYPQMTVFDNIAFSMQVRKQSKEHIKKSVEEAAAILDLTDYLDRYPKALSGGQRQRVAMGRALVRHPKVFLFDEPLSNLDAKLRAQMRFEIRRIHEKLKTTTIYVTHDQIEAMTMADKIVVMRGGNIEQIGSPDDIYDLPVNIFVADFIGAPAINLFEGAFNNQDGEASVIMGEEVIKLNSQYQLDNGHPVIMGIRPLDIEVDKESKYRGKVSFVENTGADLHIHAEFAGELIRLVSTEKFDCKSGDEIGISIDPGKIHLFDASSKQRIQ
jgi:multiple sugar transport system ATP-binding protein